jgi:hypothetical protein
MWIYRFSAEAQGQSDLADEGEGQMGQKSPLLLHHMAFSPSLLSELSPLAFSNSDLSSETVDVINAWYTPSTTESRARHRRSVT